jgi:hypothetical protein
MDAVRASPVGEEEATKAQETKEQLDQRGTDQRQV